MSQVIQPYDFVMLAVLVGTVIYGAWKGMAWQVAALASVMVSAAVAVHSSPLLAPVFGKQEPWNRFLAMAVLYIVTAVAIWLLFRLVRGAINRVQLKEFDHQLGSVFGLVKGVLYCLVITFFAVTLSETARQAVLQSRSGYYIAKGIRQANPILPADVRKWLGTYIDELDQKLHAPPKEVVPSEPAATQFGESGGEGATTGANAKSDELTTGRLGVLPH
jgi:membrane protein required for colicin V production